MSTAEKKTSQLGSWANLVICGGLSWGVNFWHATHATSTATHATSVGAHVGTALALLCATGPVVSAGFASHNMSRSGGGSFKKFLTYLVFAMGMALSITAQAEAVAGVFGNIYLGVTFALMLDLSAFMSLHSIMSAPSAEAVPETGSQDREDRFAEPVRKTVETGSENRPETGSENRPRTGQRTGSQNRQETEGTGSQNRRRTAPKSTRKTVIPIDRDELIRSLNAKHMKEHGRPISADKLIEQVRANGHKLGKVTALQILADINGRTLAAVN